MPTIKAILFDFDGTLMDTNNVIIDSWNHTCELNLGYRLPLEEIVSTFGVPLRPALEAHMPGADIEKAMADYRGYQFSHPQDIHMFEGVFDMLKAVKDRGYILGIVTSRRWEGCPLDLYGFTEAAELFDIIVSEENCTAHKPDPAPLLTALEALQMRPDEVIYVGDSPFDILCSRRAHVPVVLVGWSLCFPPEKATGELSADWVIDKPSDLLDII
ncbi:MAG: HAD-IA family hydrolase [Firmicutes bacterium]|nr:HAD-IA family hydrolase [Bacillota bacterium]